MPALRLAIARLSRNMRSTSSKSLRRGALLTLLGLLSAVITAPCAKALVVQDMTGTTVAPVDDPGWNYVSTGRNYVYLRNGWALSAFHVGLPDLESDPFDNFPEDANSDDEQLQFNGQSFLRIKNQAFVLKNHTSGLTSDTDLRLIRINGDPGLPDLNIASQELFENTPLATRQVTIIGNGPTRQDSQTQWNSSWVEVPSGGTFTGYKTVDPFASTKRWGTNQIADEDCLFNGCGNDGDLRGTIKMSLGVGPRDVVAMTTQFDANGLTNEAQVVSGDSGSGVFYKRNNVWELIGIVNAQPPVSQGQSPINAVYTGYTVFADLSYYRSEIFSIMNAPENQNYSVMGDVNLDGDVTGAVIGGVPTGDIAAFVAGWGYDNLSGAGTITSWKNGDLNRDGKTDVADFLLLRPTLPALGAGSLTLESLLGGGAVPEPSSGCLALVGVGFAAISRSRWRSGARI